MPSIQKDIVVDVPIKDAYDQWTQFESFSRFMEGVREVVQLDEKTLRWRANVGGKAEEWEAEIVEQMPERHVAWRSTAGTPNAGSVRFEPLGTDRTRVALEITYETPGTAERLGDALGVLERRVEGDLKRFKSFIEGVRTPTGAWRGEIHGGKVERGGGGPTEPLR